ncbi:MAG TPA: hypothetical protein VHN80_32320, partial [Kineosporiaceae bacterium]|nr:hypothetical protein [Kineosporiaceae bacterium]
MRLEEIAEELYGLLPDEFTAARDRHAARLRADGERELSAEVKALRRPAVPAWSVNALVRHRAEDVERLLQLGDALREAQGALDADQLRELNRRRQDLLAALGRQARAVAQELGRPVSDQVVEAVEGTFQAALADPAAAEAVRTGRLTAPLSYAGFGEVDLTDAVAVAPVRSRTEPRRTEPRRTEPAAPRDLERAEREAAEQRRAEQERADRIRMQRHREVTAARAQAARKRVDAANARVAELEALLDS